MNMNKWVIVLNDAADNEPACFGFWTLNEHSEAHRVLREDFAGRNASLLLVYSVARRGVFVQRVN
jgi:hypothetical protein